MSYGYHEEWVRDEAEQIVRQDFPFLVFGNEVAEEAIDAYYQTHDASPLQASEPKSAIERDVRERQIGLVFAKRSLIEYFLKSYGEEIKSSQIGRNAVRVSDELHRHMVKVIAKEAIDFIDDMIVPLETFKNGIEVYRGRLTNLFTENRDFVEHEPWQRVD